MSFHRLEAIASDVSRFCRPVHGSGAVSFYSPALSTLPPPSFSPQQDSPDPNLEFRSEQTFPETRRVVIWKYFVRD